MVEIKDVSSDKLHSKLRDKKTRNLINKVFGENIYVSDIAGSYYLRKKQKCIPEFVFVPIVGLMNLRPFFNFNPNFKEINLNNSKYLDKANEFAEKYEEYFGKELTINVNYL
jgi:hypothetical protein